MSRWGKVELQPRWLQEMAKCPVPEASSALAQVGGPDLGWWAGSGWWAGLGDGRAGGMVGGHFTWPSLMVNARSCV